MRTVSSPPPPSPLNANNQLQQTFGNFQMSTGINIAVSVVIASALLIALFAGYLRIKRQQQAHRVSSSAGALHGSVCMLDNLRVCILVGAADAVSHLPDIQQPNYTSNYHAS